MKHNRVLVFSTDDHCYPAGGAEQAFGNITERLPHITFDLVCAKLRRGTKGYEQVGNVHIHRLGFGIPKVDGIILALFGHYCALKLIRKHSYDFVWSIMASYGAFAAVRVKRKTGLQFLLTLQEGDSFEYIYHRVRHVRKHFDAIFKNAYGVQAISKYLLQWAREMGYEGEQGKVIPNGVHLDAFGAPINSEIIHATRFSFGFPPDALVLMTSSRLEIKNGIDVVIRALAKLPKQVCFVVCGGGSLDVEMRELVKKLHLAGRVKFLGFMEPSELPRIMQASDVFIRPSRSEGLGTAFLEAMAARMLVVGTLVGGIPDFLTDDETGFAVEVDSPESVATIVAKIMSLDDTTKTKVLDAAEQMVRDRYDWDLVAHDMEVLFNEITV